MGLHVARAFLLTDFDKRAQDLDDSSDSLSRNIFLLQNLDAVVNEQLRDFATFVAKCLVELGVHLDQEVSCFAHNHGISGLLDHNPDQV